MRILEIKRLRLAYGNLEVVHDVSMYIDQGEVVTLLGSNGAGKTTTLKAIAGLIKPFDGSIRFKERRIDGSATHKTSNLGISLVPEGRQLFPEHTIEENLELGA